MRNYLHFYGIGVVLDKTLAQSTSTIFYIKKLTLKQSIVENIQNCLHATPQRAAGKNLLWKINTFRSHSLEIINL